MRWDLAFDQACGDGCSVDGTGGLKTFMVVLELHVGLLGLHERARSESGGNSPDGSLLGREMEVDWHSDNCCWDSDGWKWKEYVRDDAGD